MKGQKVGENSEILWPNEKFMAQIEDMSRRSVETENFGALDLLWPAALINEQIKARNKRSWAQPLAVMGFILSLILVILVGPVQLILLATVLDYDWVSVDYYPSALHAVLITTGVVAMIDFLALVLGWRAQLKQTCLTMILSLGSMMEIGVIWLFGKAWNWPPQLLSFVAIVVMVIFVMVALLTNKHYFTKTRNGTATKVILSILMVVALVEVSLSGVYLFEPMTLVDNGEMQALMAAYDKAYLMGTPRFLSDLAYTLCGEPYEIVYLSQDNDSGIFQCKKSGEIYSVGDTKERGGAVVKGFATYLGTVDNEEINSYFPDAKYLYRNLTQLNESELALMVAANSEEELVDNIVQPLLNYWQTHNYRNLFFNVFYNEDLGAVISTKDFVLMAAMDTLALTNELPRGNSYTGYRDEKVLPYNFTVDQELKALNELGADPTLYADASRIGLTNLRHISVRLAAGEEYDWDSLREKLLTSFVGGIE